MPAPDRSASLGPSGPTGTLAARVRRRVDRAHARLARQDAASPDQPVDSQGAAPPPPSSQSQHLSREERALGVVFREMGRTYRQYRLDTGQPISLPLRDAGRAFRQERSLLSLIPVAGFLDDLHLLTW